MRFVFSTTISYDAQQVRNLIKSYFNVLVNSVFPFGTTAHIWALSSSVLKFINNTQRDAR
jgi:hypothetical protein